MTTKELLFTQMFPAEEEKWQELCNAIRKIFATLKLPAVAQKEWEEILAPGTPYTGAKGYVEPVGYFYVEAGDRGECTAIFKTKSLEEAKDLLMKKLAHDVSYKCAVAEKKQTELKHRGDWRFYEVEDGRVPGNGRVPGRILSHQEENATWKYDAKYDYRKYWFELALYILKGNVSDEMFQAEVQEYERLLNLRFEQPFWRFDAECMEFVCR